MSLPIDEVPLKNSTLVMVPSVSAAVAASAIVAGAVNAALFTGVVILTVGGALARMVNAVFILASGFGGLTTGAANCTLASTGCAAIGIKPIAIALKGIARAATRAHARCVAVEKSWRIVRLVDDMRVSSLVTVSEKVGNLNFTGRHF